MNKTKSDEDEELKVDGRKEKPRNTIRWDLEGINMGDGAAAA
jgi:hypothetical protein